VLLVVCIRVSILVHVRKSLVYFLCMCVGDMWYFESVCVCSCSELLCVVCVCSFVFVCVDVSTFVCCVVFLRVCDVVFLWYVLCVFLFYVCCVFLVCV